MLKSALAFIGKSQKCRYTFGTAGSIGSWQQAIFLQNYNISKINMCLCAARSGIS
jgi:hypothetical protein